MYKLERLLVALDLTEMDDILIQYTSTMAEYFQTEKVYFFHVANSFELPEEVRTSYPDLLAPTDESIQNAIEIKIEKEWKSGYSCEKVVELKEGNPTDQLLKWIDIKDVDMLVMGRKRNLKGSGVLPQKVTKVAHSSVLLVPETLSQQLKTVVVPVDFSKHSILAMEEAISLTQKTGAQLKALNTYKVPSGYHKTGKSREEFAEIMKGHAQKDFENFISKNNFENGFTCDFIHDDDSPADTIFNYAKSKNADLIIMGSKGRTGLASILLGSVTEKVINYDADIPLMVIKEKEENMGFLKALLNI